MSDSSRRGFLILAGAGAAAVGAAAVAPAASASCETDDVGQAEGALVAYVSDLRRGEVSVMKGEREVVIHDKALCATLARALK
jgi:Rieske Fe-S protein